MLGEINLSTVPTLSQLAGSSILLITAERIGDVLFCTPGIRLLKKHYPDLQIDVLIFKDTAAEIFAYNSDVNQVHTTNSPRKIRRLAKNYPLAINLTYEFSKYLTRFPIPLISIGTPNFEIHRAEQVLQFIQSLIDCHLTDTDHQYVLTPPQDYSTRVAELLQQHNVDLKENILIGCQLGCHRIARRGWKFWDNKRHIHRKVWPLENYLALGKKISLLNSKIRLVLTGSPTEKFLAKPFVKQIPETINLIGKTSILEAAALMDYLTVYLTHDTGTLHIACARNTPLIALFGSTLPRFTGPYPKQDHHCIIQKDSMAEITVDEVYAAIEQRCCITRKEGAAGLYG